MLVDAFQQRLLLITLAYLGTALLVFSAVLFLPLMVQLIGGPPNQQQVDAARQFLVLHTRLWPALLVVFVILVFHSLVTSNRIAGPLFRFRSVYRQLAGGDLSATVSIRKTDYLHTDADALNELIRSLRVKVRDLSDQSDRIQRLVSELTMGAAGVRDEADTPATVGVRADADGRGGAGSPGELIEIAERLAAEAARLQEGIHWFRLSSPSPSGDADA